MLADIAARVLARRTRFRTEAGRLGAIPLRQGFLVKDLVGVEVGHRHFGGGDQVVFPIRNLEEIFLEFGKLARACMVLRLTMSGGRISVRPCS